MSASDHAQQAQGLWLLNASTLEGERVDVLVKGHYFDKVLPHDPSRALEKGSQEGCEVLHAEGALISPPFVDAHFHLDATLSLGRPRLNHSGTLLEGIELWAEQKPSLTEQDIYDRAHELICWAVARGTLMMRSHLDVCDPQLRAARALTKLKRDVAPFFDLQLVAFPQDGYLRHPQAKELLPQALDMGVDVVGGIPHFERSAAAGRESVELLCRLAADRHLRVDMHCDETDDPHSRHIETLAEQTLRFGLQGQVSASHVTSLHSAPNEFAAKLIPLLAEANVSVIANPLINITLQGRHDTYPKRRGMTRVPELMAGGVNVAFGHDCVMDPWYALGSADMLEVAQMGLHVAQMTSLEGMRACFEAVTLNSARALGFKPWQLSEGAPATFVLLDARDPIEALRLRATRLLVMREGVKLAETPRAHAQLTLPSAEAREVSFQISSPCNNRSE